MTLETFFFLHPLFMLFVFAISTVLFYLKAFYSVYTPNTGPLLISQNKKEVKIWNLYNQAPHQTQDTMYESDKNTIKHHKQESQEVSPFPAGDHKAI